MAKCIGIVVDTSGSMVEDCKGAVVKYVLNTIASVMEEDEASYKMYLVGNEAITVENMANVKISYGGELTISAVRNAFADACDGYLLVSDGCFNSEIESLLTKYKNHIISVAIGSDVMLNNLQRCSRDKKVYQASDIIAAIREI